jgi:TctA family transporter
MSETLTPNGGVNFGGADQELALIEQQSQLQQAQLQQFQSHQPSTFRRILGGVAGMAGNAFAPGLGGALGNMIAGGSSNAAANAASLAASTAASAANLEASGFAANAANLAAANALQAVATQANQDEERTELAANLEKSKHETFMAVIQNIT